MADHNGVCGFCGSPVKRGFTVCPACGAVWEKVETGLGGFLFEIVRVPIGIGFTGGLLGFIVPHSNAALGVAVVSAVLGAVLWSGATRWRWVRRQP
jgi:hypothetical protein